MRNTIVKTLKNSGILKIFSLHAKYKEELNITNMAIHLAKAKLVTTTV